MTAIHQSLRSAAQVLFVAAAATFALPAQTVQLADGQVLLAKVEDAYGDGLRVQRLDNGGTLELRWDQLSVDCAQRIKVAFALAGEDTGEPTVTVSEIRYAQNGSPQVVLGRIVDQSDPQTFVVQQKGVQYRVPRKEVTQMRQVEAPASQVYTPEEYYSLRLSEVAPGDSADLHRTLAEDLVKVRDYAHALEHLGRAKELANSRAPEQIEALLGRVKIYVEAKKERDLLDQIQVARARGGAKDFELGLRLIAQFEKDYPQSRLKGDFEAEKKRFGDARERVMAQLVAENWRRAINVVGDKKLQEPGVTLGQAREYATSKMGDEIAAYVASRLKLEVEETRALFGKREKYAGGRRSEHFSYGIGSWVLGEAAITKDTKVGAENKEKLDPQAQRDLDRLAKALQKLREQSRTQGKGGAGAAQGQDHEQTDEEWWSGCDRNERGNWLRAYYAEFSGQMKIVGAYNQPCFNCNGLGETSEPAPAGPGQGQSNKIIKVKCYLCHKTKWLRSFRAW